MQEADDALLRNLEYQIQSQFLQDDINSTRERHKKVGGVSKCPSAYFLSAAALLKYPILVPAGSHGHIKKRTRKVLTVKVTIVTNPGIVTVQGDLDHHLLKCSTLKSTKAFYCKIAISRVFIFKQ